MLVGIATLVFSHYPTWTRAQVVTRLQQSTGNSVTSNGNGYGIPYADCAVGYLCHAGITGPMIVTETGYYTFSASAMGDDPLAFQWQTNETTATKQTYIEVPPGTDYYYTEQVTVRDVITNDVLIAQKTVHVLASNGCIQCGISADPSSQKRRRIGDNPRLLPRP